MLYLTKKKENWYLGKFRREGLAFFSDEDIWESLGRLEIWNSCLASWHVTVRKIWGHKFSQTVCAKSPTFLLTRKRYSYFVGQSRFLDYFSVPISLIGASTNAWLLYHWLFLNHFGPLINSYCLESSILLRSKCARHLMHWARRIAKRVDRRILQRWNPRKELLDHQHGEVTPTYAKEAHGCLTMATLSPCVQELPGKSWIMPK